MEKGILSGLRILDLTRVLSGPFATRLLADFGAEVIKVQSRKTATGTESNLTGTFNTWNRNKRSITLDMNHPEARKIALKLTALSDVVIENFAPRVMANWDLTYERLREFKSDLIMVSLSGMGQEGPWRNFVTYAPTLHALSGLTFLTSFHGEDPLGPGFAYADTVAGLYAVFAVLAALEHRTRTGEGQYIDLSQYEAICTSLGPTLLDLAAHPREMAPGGNRPGSAGSVMAAPWGCYRCKGEDRWCVIAIRDEGEWEAFSRAIGNPGWCREERFSTLLKRMAHSEELHGLVERWTGQVPPEEACSLLQKAGVPAGVVQNAEDLAHDPQLLV